MSRFKGRNPQPNQTRERKSRVSPRSLGLLEAQGQIVFPMRALGYKQRGGKRSSGLCLLTLLPESISLGYNIFVEGSFKTREITDLLAFSTSWSLVSAYPHSAPYHIENLPYSQTVVLPLVTDHCNLSRHV